MDHQLIIPLNKLNQVQKLFLFIFKDLVLNFRLQPSIFILLKPLLELKGLEINLIIPLFSPELPLKHISKP